MAGIEADLRRMALAGASDDVLQSFVDARRRGDADLADRLLTLTQEPFGPAPALTPLQRLRVAALRPAVNSLDTHVLYSYVRILWPLSDQIVRSYQDPNHWASDTFVDSIAQSLMRVTLEHIQRGSAGLRQPNQP